MTGVIPTGTFAVAVLGSGQEGISNLFARRGGDRWADVEWSPAPSGNPVVHGEHEPLLFYRGHHRVLDR